MRSKKKITPFGKFIRKRLVDLDMDQSDLAAAVGTSSANITYIIYGERSSERWIQKICQALGVADEANRFAEGA